MANYFYTDANGRKQGPISVQQLKVLAMQGVIAPQTPIETESGSHKGVAGQISGLDFAPAPPPAPNSVGSTSIGRAAPSGLPGQPSESLEATITPTVSDQDTLQLSRAVFIFLAVFVGLFGIHDFYAKRVKQGWIHLALLLPWILVFVVSVLAVFCYSLYVWTSSPHRKEIRECQRALKVCEKEIGEAEQKRVALLRKIEDAKAGTLKKPKEVTPPQETPREIIPQQEKPKEILPRQDRPREVTPKQERPREIIPEPTVEIDMELVRELTRSLMELEHTISDLKRQQEGLQGTIVALRLKQGAEKIPAWISTGPLWLYFFFFVLPFASWVMAMVEIIYVTKDGYGKELCC